MMDIKVEQNGDAGTHDIDLFLDAPKLCPKCGTPTPGRYLSYGRCPDCLVAETRANAEATQAEFARLMGVEAEWHNLMADRKVLLDSINPDAVLARDEHRAFLYRRLAVILLGCLLGKYRAALPDLAWLRELAWDDSPLVPEDAALIDALASPETSNRDGEFIP